MIGACVTIPACSSGKQTGLVSTPLTTIKNIPSFFPMTMLGHNGSKHHIPNMAASVLAFIHYYKGPMIFFCLIFSECGNVVITSARSHSPVVSLH